MNVIVGLGNPGEKFEKTRHNAGFVFLDRYQEFLEESNRFKISEWEYDKYVNADISVVKEGGAMFMLLVKPQSFMNLSGDVVKELYKQKELSFDTDPLTVVHDDLDIQYGEYKIQMGVGPKGHNGILNINDRIGTTQYNRIRLGVEARENKNIPGEDYVLFKMNDEELVTMYEMIDRAISEFGLNQ
jgi:PTH1 family peptidyl-tRNA hydrolase